MKIPHSSILLVAYGLSNAAGLLMLWASFSQPRLARLTLVALFAWAAFTNYSVCHHNPQEYLGYSRFAIGYNSFIKGWFRLHITDMVTAIAAGQALIALGIFYRGIWVKIACSGAIIFLLAITPLGFGAAFPFPLIVAFAAWNISKRDDGKFIWSGCSLYRSDAGSAKKNY